MAHLIDKDALVAEIQRRAIEAGLHDGVIAEIREDECYSILSLIDTLEVKEVDINKLCEFRKNVGFAYPDGASEYQKQLACYRQGIKDVIKAQKGALDTLNLSNVERTGKNWKEPVSEDLEQAIDNYLATYWGGEKEKQDWPFLKKIAIHFAEWKKNHLWKDAQGDDLPEIDREVVVLVQDYPDDKDHLRVAFAHRPNKYAKVWNSDLGEEQTIEIERHGKGGWNIPNVKYWLDVVFPKEMEE